MAWSGRSGPMLELRPLRHGHVLRLRQGRLVGRRRGGDGVRRQVLDDHRLLAAAAEVVELDRVGGPLDEEAAEAGAGLGLEVGAGVVLGGEGGVPRQALVVHRDLDAGGDALAGDVEAPALVAAERPVDHVGGRLLHDEVEAAQLLVREPGLARVLAHERLHHRQEGERARHGERAATHLRARLVLRHPIPSSVVARPPCSASRRTIPYPWNAPVCPARPSRRGPGGRRDDGRRPAERAERGDAGPRRAQLRRCSCSPTRPWCGPPGPASGRCWPS